MSDLFDLFRQIRQPAAGPISAVIAGLGNVGREYEGTRHNAGFMAIDDLAAACGAGFDRVRFHAYTAEATVAGVRTLLLKPTTFMNLSGQAISAAMAFYKLPPQRLLVLCDDISFAPGRLRLRRSGSHGGHNGLRNIIDLLGTDAFPRLKIGVGQKPRPDYDLVDWVLGRLPQADRDAIAARFPDIRAAISLWLQGDLDAAMNRYSK